MAQEPNLLDDNPKLILPTTQFPKGKRRPSQAAQDRLAKRISRKLQMELIKEEKDKEANA